MHKARKRFGQNFLHDEQVIDRIIRSIRPKHGDQIVEIGPGQGALTAGLAEATQGKMQVIELDRDLIPILKVKFFNYPDFIIHEADAMKFDYSQLASHGKIRIAGNLPYNISTPLLFHLVSFSSHIADMHFMLQKEVVQRICAEPGGGDYGRLSVMMQYYCDTEYLFTVKPGAFNPAPKVDSAIVRLIPRPTEKLNADSETDLQDVVRQSFSQRRKTLKNNLKNWLTEDQIISLDIDPKLRPERLSLQQFIALANLYSSTKKID